MQVTDASTYVDTTASILYDSSQDSKGSMWIVGRSIVIHKANGDRWACANIGTAGTGTIVTFPEAAGQPDGTIQLFQPSVFWDTSMIVDLAGLEAGNKWHVHSYPVPGSGDCMGTGGHFDPAGADYTGSEAPPPYEYGDLSGKWGKLNAPSLIGANDLFVNTGRGFVSDSTLPLSGSMSVLGRSIVIHRTDGTRWACATIPMRILVTFPDMGPSYPYGSVLLYQESVTAPLSITASFMQLEAVALGAVRPGNKWHGAPHASVQHRARPHPGTSSLLWLPQHPEPPAVRLSSPPSRAGRVAPRSPHLPDGRGRRLRPGLLGRGHGRPLQPHVQDSTLHARKS